MKNVIRNTKKGILMAIMMTALLSFGKEKASFFSIVNGAERTSVTLINVDQGDLLSIKDENGMVLYKESIQTKGVFTKGFDLTSLPNGEYLFELNKDVEISTIPFKVEASKVSFKKELEKTFFKPMTRIKGNLVFINKLSLEKAPMAIEVYSGIHGDYELMYSETIKNTEKIERLFRLTGMNIVDYKIIYRTEGRVFTEMIKS
ncbi:hypothetical protein [Flavisericum labens]|uniref:hypothetical protein n=1 Tax=Flavisericum labens TaxID=3377112 RepID=UPI00387B2712